MEIDQTPATNEVPKSPANHLGEKLLTIKELGAMLQVTRFWINDRLHTWHPEKIPHFKLGRYVRFRESEIKRWLEKHKRV